MPNPYYNKDGTLRYKPDLSMIGAGTVVPGDCMVEWPDAEAGCQISYSGGAPEPMWGLKCSCFFPKQRLRRRVLYIVLKELRSGRLEPKSVARNCSLTDCSPQTCSPPDSGEWVA